MSLPLKRHFTIVSASTIHGRVKKAHNLGGRFSSTNALSAAKKALSKICVKSSIKGQCTLTITLRETTRGKDGKLYTYKLKRVRKPVTVERAGTVITFKYHVYNVTPKKKKVKRTSK